MRFLEIINNKKYTLISIFLFLYVIVNLFEGDRGITSYYKNKQIKKHLIEEGKILNNKLALVEKKRLEEEAKMTKELEKIDREAAKEELKNLIKVK